MDDSLSLFELPRAFVKPALEMCRTFNSTLDVAFYDVPTLVAELRARGAASIDLDALANPEGALLVVDPARAPFIQRFEDLKSFLDWKAGADAPQTKSRLQDALAVMTPELASVGRHLVGSLPDTRRIHGAPVFRTGSGSS